MPVIMMLKMKMIGIVRHAGGESLYIYYFTSREDNLSLWVIVTITFITFNIIIHVVLVLNAGALNAYQRIENLFGETIINTRS